MRICSVEGCNRKHLIGGYCNKHRLQIRYHGKILERTKFDPNEFIKDEDVYWVVLYNIKNKEVARAKFDAKYYEQINNPNLKWHLDNQGYVRADWYDKTEHQYIFLHQAIIQLSGQEVPDGYEIDHKDLNKLNCLEDNLRVCSYAENTHNSGKQKNNISGFTGVSWHKGAKKWRTQLRANGRKVYDKHFDDPIDAAKAYNIAAIKYFGEFAVLNKV